MYGWAGRRVRTYLTEGKIIKEGIPEWLRREYLGGRGFNSRVLWDEVEAGIDPLGPENVLMVAVGPISGTLAPVAGGRWTVTAKSPVTGLVGDGNGGGHFAAELKFAGYDQIIIHGRSPKPVCLYINDGRVELGDASHLWGKTTWEAHDLLVKELGDREIQTLTIGPAGENQVLLAKVMANKARAGGKCGMGAVMGSKNLKAVVVRGAGSVKIAQPEEFYDVAKDIREKLLSSEYQQMFKEKGTMAFFRTYATKGALTARNSQAGYFEGWENLSSEAFEEQYAVRHSGCFACPVSCTHVYQVKDGPYACYGHANEFGTSYPLSSKIGSDNLASTLKLATICDQFGLDTHSTGGTISFAMEAWQRGLISAKDTDGLDLSWGNVDAVIQLVHKIAYRQGFGDLLAQGSKKAAQEIKGSEICLSEVKGLEASHYYPGFGEAKGVALAFATSPIGGSLHKGSGRGPARLNKILSEKQLVDPSVYEGQGIALAESNDFNAAVNSIDACNFLCGDRGVQEDDLARLVSAATGMEIDGDGLMKVGERIFNVEKAFNLREGFRRKDDYLPERFFFEEVTDKGTDGIDRAKFDAMLDEYYQARGWDQESFPTEEKLKELNLADVAEQLRGLRTRG